MDLVVRDLPYMGLLYPSKEPALGVGAGMPEAVVDSM